MKTKYRVLENGFGTFTVEKRSLLLWSQVGYTKFLTLEGAKAHIALYESLTKKPKVVYVTD